MPLQDADVKEITSRLRVRYATHFTQDNVPKDEPQTSKAKPTEIAVASDVSPKPNSPANGSGSEQRRLTKTLD